MEELALNILDLVQNCVEAGATAVEVHITEDSASNELVIVIADNGRGMDSNTVASVVDPFFTTRTTRRVGLGIPLLKGAADMAGGGMTIESAPGVGTTVTTTFQRDHIDRPPLGKLADTMAAIFALHSALQLSFSHRVDGQAYALKSSEIRDVVGDDVGHPKVVRWIRDYISENEEELGGEQ